MSETKAAPDLTELLSDFEYGVIECERTTGPFYRRRDIERDEARAAIVTHVRELRAELTRLQQANAALVERERVLTDTLQELLNAPYEPNTLAGGLAHMSAESNAKRALASQ